MSLKVIPFFHDDSNTLSYILYCAHTKVAAVIDAVADYNSESHTLSYSSADKLLAYINKHQLQLQWIIETHVHADHLSACAYLRQHSHGKIVVSEHITEVQQTLKPIYQLDCATDGSQFDVHVKDGDILALGDLNIEIIATPGHTPDGISLYCNNQVFIGDTLFMPDSGSARCDFPNGSAAQLYDSITRLLALPGHTKVWVCHDYQPNDRALDCHSTILEQRQANVHLQQHKEDFIAQRQLRDASLNKPRLMDIAVPFNLQGALVL
ncbi:MULTISPECIES: MBL fold metallo-hydrolase [unclassified Pseudoalteromonas]|uniref:MBL fold metallo-hydrolase n=1 Tax=unclassified Pseudoalteromonas TaxID=194690 RepID=UPI000CF60250|nr:MULTISPECIES: MBL fold metallo-hydrolase [unclassified Pseudoalteromonas]